MKPEDFKYRTRFHSTANFELLPKLTKKVSTAAYGLDELQSLLPSEEYRKNNQDCLYACFNAAVVNLVNLNGDGMDTETALKVSKTFLFKPMNLEHERGNIVGVITNVGFSSFNKNKLLTEEEILSTNDPFNISLAAIVWKLSDEWFAERLGESQKGSSYETPEVISTSWEVGFNEYYILVGSKNLKDGEIIKDPEKIKEYEKYLIAEGGKGFTPEGKEVYRIISGDAIFLGCAFTLNPAAAVKGVHVIEGDVTLTSEDEDASNKNTNWRELVENKLAVCASLNDFIQKMEDEEVLNTLRKQVLAKINEKGEEMLEKYDFLEKKSQEISFQEKTNVFSNDMSEEQTAQASVSAQEISQQIRAELVEANDKYLEEKRIREEAEAKVQQTQEEFEQLKASHEKLVNEFNALRAEAQRRQDQYDLNVRMEALKEEFSLTEDQSQVIASQISGLTEEDFKTWKEKQSLFLTPKTSQASTQVVTDEKDASEVIENLQQTVASIPNAVSVENIRNKALDGLKKGAITILTR